MPKIRQGITEAVFYLFRINPLTGCIEGPCGTGFFVIRSSIRSNGAPHIYEITNWHVALDAGASIIRINTSDGKSRFVELDPSEWEQSAEGDDLAATDLSEKLNQSADQVIGLYEDMFITPDLIRKFEIGLGEDTFMCGLFTGHHGGERNIPVTTFGNLAMLANAAAPVKLETGAERPC